jgi:hypothetical protein
LYIPGERALSGGVGSAFDARAAAKHKDLVQRLESTLLHWTRQIKEVRSGSKGKWGAWSVSWQGSDANKSPSLSDGVTAFSH